MPKLKVGFMRRNKKWWEVIKKETENCKLTRFTTPDGAPYHYVILPFDYEMSEEFIKAVTTGMGKMLREEIKKAQAILAIEAKGFIPASWLAQAYRKKLLVIRKRDYKITEQVKIRQTKAYGKGMLYWVKPNKTIKNLLIVEDIISSGETLISTIHALLKHKYQLVGIGSVYNRGNGIEKVKEETGFQAKSLAQIEIKLENNHPRAYVEKFYFEK